MNEIFVELLTIAQRNIPALLVMIVVIVGILMIIRQRKVDQAVRVFRRAGLHVKGDAVERLRDDFAKVASENERLRLVEENKQRQEMMIMQRERDRILATVQNAPVVVKEAGKALQAIEKEYEANLSMVKSEQAKEALRLATEKQIHEVLLSVNVHAPKLPQFELPTKPDLTNTQAAQELMASD